MSLRRAKAALFLGAAALLSSACHRHHHYHHASEWPQTMRATTAEAAVSEVRDAKGEKVLLVLYASWCGSCRRELPAIEALAQRHDGDVRLLAYSLDEEPADFAEMLDEHRPSFPLVRLAPPSPERVTAALRTVGSGYHASIPYTAVFDRSGALVAEWSSKAEPAAIEQALAATE